MLSHLLPMVPCKADIKAHIAVHECDARICTGIPQPRGVRMAAANLAVSVVFLAGVALDAAPAQALYRITNDRGGYVEEYKARYAKLRDRGERVVIDGVCNSACTLVFGIVPANRICVTPRASLGFHQAYYDKAFTFGIKFTSNAGTDELMSYYPAPVKDWIRRQGGLTSDMKKVRNGMDLWKIADPCPEEF